MYRREQGLPVEAARLAGVPPAAEGEAVFVSPHENFRITLWTDWNNVAIGNYGQRIPDRREAQFRNGVYRTTDVREIQAFRKASSNGILFFERAKLEQLAHDAKMQAAMAAAEDPEVAAALRTKLGVSEMPLPPRDSAEAEKPLKPIR